MIYLDDLSSFHFFENKTDTIMFILIHSRSDKHNNKLSVKQALNGTIRYKTYTEIITHSFLGFREIN